VVVLAVGADRSAAQSVRQEKPGHGKPPRYEFISVELPNSQGALGLTTLTDINNRGELVGGFAAADAEGFLISERRGVVRMRCPDVTFQTAPLGINNFGLVAGFCDTRGFIRGRNGRFLFIEADGAFYTEARGINDRNQVVGYFRDTTGFHPFVWQAGVLRVLDLAVPGEPNLDFFPSGINNHGQIVGMAVDRTCGCNERGFVSNLRDGEVTFIAVPGSTITIVNAINDRGQLAGFYVDASQQHHGFVLDDGRVTTIDAPFAGAVLTEVAGINNRGDLVGRYGVTEPVPANYGFVAVATGRRQATPPK
jgi:hypothetical protein